MSENAKSLLRATLALAKVTELEAMVLIQEIYEEERAAPKPSATLSNLEGQDEDNH